MLDRIIGNPITSWIGVIILIAGSALLGFGKITWEQFLVFLALSGVGALLKDPLKKE